MRPPGNIVGAQVGRFRRDSGLSQAALAGKCQLLGWDIGREGIAQIEGGTRCVSDIELTFLAHLLSVKTDALLPESAQKAAIKSARRKDIEG